ncbi:MAG: DUF5119 domain-containing protein [Paramuribaculum sp.]|nr:DUF5119 domain-containing protein [Paramuribaculum sp.]
MRAYYLNILFAASLLLLTSCREDLCYEHSQKAMISLSYEQEWERDYGMAHPANWNAETHGGDYDSHRPSLPESVNMHVYSQESGNTSLTFLGRDGGEANLGREQCDILLYNNDTEYVLIDDNASVVEMTATTTTRSRSTLEPMHLGERTVSAPDVLYGTYLTDVPKTEAHKETTMNAVLRPLVYTYIIRYEFEQGIEYAKLARGAIAGMAEKVFLKDGSTGSDKATVLYDCEIQPWGVIAKVNTFGVPDFPGEHYRDGAVVNPALDFVVNLEVMCANGKIKTFEQNVTEQIRKQPRGGVLTVKGLAIDGAGMNSGFNASVDDWGEWTDVELPGFEVK